MYHAREREREREMIMFSSPSSFSSSRSFLGTSKQPFNRSLSKSPQTLKPRLLSPKQNSPNSTPPFAFLTLKESSFNSVVIQAQSNQAAVRSPVPLDTSDGDSPTEVVKQFYGGINRRDLVSVAGLIADGCVYEDLIFPHPFVGHKAIMEFFEKFTDQINGDLQFVIDDISGDDSSTVGVTWHLEWKGRRFPFSKGCSVYRLEVIDGKRQIVYGRDLVEPALKPGELAVVAIRGVIGLLQKFPRLADFL